MAESENSADSAAGDQPGTASSLANQSNEQVTRASIFVSSRVVTPNTEKNTERRRAGKAVNVKGRLQTAYRG